MKYRFLSFAAAAVTAFSSCGIPASALETAGFSAATETVASGTCGDNLTWVLDDEGTMTISGSGEMTYFSGNIEKLWSELRESIKKVVIADGVTSIEMLAFYEFINLTSVAIPKSVISIGDDAFAGCHGLKSVTIPDSVTRIGNEAFRECTGLTSLTIPDSVTSIGYGAFSGCTSLTSVTIPDSVTSIGRDAFYGCTSLTSVTIPDSVTSIGRDAFYGCAGLTSVLIPHNVTSIGEAAFWGCTGLSSVTIPDSVTSLEKNAFSNCTGVKDITILNPECEIYDLEYTIANNAVIHGYTGSTAQTYAQKYGRTFEAIEAEAPEIIASGSRSNLSWTLDSAGTLTLSGSGSMPIIYTEWRSHKDEIIKAVVSEGFTDLVEDAFSGCSNLTEIQLPDSLKTIHRNAFTGTAWLEAKRAEDPLVTVGGILVDGAAASGAVVIPDSVSSIAEYAFSGNTALTSVTLPETVTAVSSNAFNGCTALASVTLPEGVLSVGGYAFTKCTALKTLDIPASLTSFDAAAVSGCTALSAVNVSADNEKYMSEDGILYNKTKTTLMLFPPDKAEPYTFPDSVRYVSANAFAENQHLTEITVPAGVKLSGSYIFRNCKNLTKAVLPDDLTDLQSGLFSGCSALTSVNIPAGVTQISRGPFDGCTSLAELTIPETVTMLGTFWNCCAPDARITILNKNCDLSGFQIQQGVTLIGYPYSTAYDYADAHGITFEALPSDLPEDVIDTGTCGENLTWTLYTDGNLEITGSGYMEDYSDRYSYSPEPKRAPWYARRDHITSVSLPNGLNGIGSGAFAECVNLESVQIPSSMRDIRTDAFAGCTALTAVKLPDSVGTISEGAFRGCKSLESVTLPKGLYELGRYAFAECESLTSVKIPGGLDNLSDSVFTGCTSLSKFTVDTENRSYVAVGGVLFSKAMDVLYYYPPAKSGTVYQVPKTVRIIREQAFAYCENLTEIQFPDILDWVGDGAFLGCSGLETAELPDSLTEHIGAGIFEGCTALTEVRLPAVITTIPAYMFADCVSLTAMDLPESVTAVGRSAFSGCASLETVTFRNPAFDFGKFREALESYNGYINQFAVSGYTGSTAEAYAASSGRSFIPLDSPIVTTTTTTVTTTLTTTTTTTTTATVTTTAPAKQEPFRYGLDEWGFINDRDLLGVRDGKKYSYYLRDEDYNTMLSMLSDTEKEQIRKRLESPVFGYCYGMSVSSILGYYGAFQPSELVSGTKHLAEIDKENITDAVRSAVNYYQLMQYTKAIAQVTRATEGASDEKKLKPLIEALDAGKPAVLGYVYQGQGDNKIGHAVVAYGIDHEAGSIPISNTENFVFDACIRVYDNQAPSYQSHSQDLYVNTNKWIWCIPMTDTPSEYSKLAVMNLSAHHSGSITLVLTEPDIMNCCGLFGGKKPEEDNPDFKYERACIRYVPLNGLSNHGALEKSPDGTLNAAAGSGNIRFSADMNADEADSERLAYIDSDVGFYLTPSTAQAMSMSMEYEHFLMSAKADQSEKMLFTPDAEIECKNTSGAYEMEMVIDKEARGIDWHKITISGKNGGNIRMQLEPGGKGIILSGDSLKNVTVRANTYETEAKRTFSADYASVRIYEIDEKTIGIAADTNGDSVYETEIPAETERQKGDADGDGEITNKDAQYVLIAYTESLGTGVVDLPEADALAADVDGDGKVGVADAQYILIYYTANTIAGSPTGWEDIITAGG